jgi:putative MATE family efflux protein
MFRDPMDAILHRNVTRLAQASMGRALFSLALPIVLSNTLVTSHQLINALWLGRLGAGAVAAVSISFPIVFLLAALGGGVVVASSILVSQYAGARAQAAVNHVSAQTLLVVLAVSFLLSAIGYISVHPLLRLMGVGSDIFADAARYMRVSILGIAFMFTFSMFQSIVLGTGETKVPLYVIAASVVLNLILDPLFIFGWGPIPRGGVVGAAYATLVTEGLAAIVGFRILFGSHYAVRLRFEDFLPNLVLVKRIFWLGLPASIEQSSGALGMTVLTGLVSHFGTTAIAAYGIGFRVVILALIPAGGISMATGTLVGQGLGAGNPARARQTAVVSARYAFGILAVVAVPVFAGATGIVRFLVPTDSAVISEGGRVVRAMAVALGFIGIEMSLIGAIRGAGDTLMPMVLTIVSLWVIQIPAAYVLSNYTSLGEQGLWYSFPISAVATALLTILWFNTRRWGPVIRTEQGAVSTPLTPSAGAREMI